MRVLDYSIKVCVVGAIVCACEAALAVGSLLICGPCIIPVSVIGFVGVSCGVVGLVLVRVGGAK